MQSAFRSVLRSLALLAVVGSLAACVGGGARERSRARIPGDVVTAAEIAETSASTAYHALEMLRPTFLRARGSQTFQGSYPPVVYLDGQRWGEIESLRSIPAGDVALVRRLSAADAQSKFGMDNFGGVLEITTKRGSRS